MSLFLIAGLGNPGRDYEKTRHNAGFMLADRIARESGIEIRQKDFFSYWGKGSINGADVVIAKPQTYMNLSGQAVGAISRFFKIPAESIIVAYDDCDLPLGRIRIRKGGGSGGHKGIESIISHLSGNDFPRIRMGVGRPLMGGVKDYVLQPFRPEESQALEGMLSRGEESIRVLLKDGIDEAMNRFNASE